MRMTRICANTANDDTNKNKLKTQKSPPEEDPPLEEKVKITSLRRRRPPSSGGDPPSEEKVKTFKILSFKLKF